jgi:hypothetical protein
MIIAECPYMELRPVLETSGIRFILESLESLVMGRSM